MLDKNHWQITCEFYDGKWQPNDCFKNFTSVEEALGELKALTGIDPNDYCSCCGPHFFYHVFDTGIEVRNEEEAEDF